VSCPQLSSLNLRKCSEVTDKGVGKLAAGCPQLSSLNLACCCLIHFYKRFHYDRLHRESHPKEVQKAR